LYRRSPQAPSHFYVIDSFAFAGRFPAEAEGLEGSWSHALFPDAKPRHGEFPLDLDIVNF
jgi:hypothetical protein